MARIVRREDRKAAARWIVQMLLDDDPHAFCAMLDGSLCKGENLMTATFRAERISPGKMAAERRHPLF